MGAVFEAEQNRRSMRRRWKVCGLARYRDVNAVELDSKREAETVARLDHTNIVPIYSVGNEGAVDYFAMQLIDGQGLDQIIKSRQLRGVDSASSRRPGTGRPPRPRAADQRGVIDRDVKPSNLTARPRRADLVDRLRTGQTQRTM